MQEFNKPCKRVDQKIMTCEGICKASKMPFKTNNRVIRDMCYYHRHKINRKSVFRDNEELERLIEQGFFCELAKTHVLLREAE